jgi:hypothetical protein
MGNGKEDKTTSTTTTTTRGSCEVVVRGEEDDDDATMMGRVWFQYMILITRGVPSLKRRVYILLFQ